MKQRFLAAAFFVSLNLGVIHASSILLDWSPDTTGATLGPTNAAGAYTNLSTGINLADLISFEFDVEITGMDIFSRRGPASLGDALIVRTWANDPTGGDDPDPNTLSSFSSAITRFNNNGQFDYDGISANNRSANDVRVNTEFGSNSFTLAANTGLWIGISSPTDVGGLSLFGPNAPGDGKLAVLGGENYLGKAGVGDLAMRIYGHRIADSGSTILLLGIGLISITMFRRKRAG